MLKVDRIGTNIGATRHSSSTGLESKIDPRTWTGLSTHLAWQLAHSITAPTASAAASDSSRLDMRYSWLEGHSLHPTAITTMLPVSSSFSSAFVPCLVMLITPSSLFWFSRSVIHGEIAENWYFFFSETK